MMEPKNKIPLRQFYRNIDDYIINQAHEEAILYSKFLLEKYPRNVNVYQLLAKTYLDTKKFDLAQYLFEIILRIDPDDFVSHIGISIISENFGNLERALESMRRAYEIQPSNESLQKEVIRLVREKDGFAPEKLRLTRGALIKMYTRSKLTEQAIAEAKLGIHESPERIDYRIHLTEMLLQSGKDEDAIEQSLKIIGDLPYCKPILTILYKAFSYKDNSEDAEIYRSRLSELDPYFVFMKPETKTVNDIPDVAIMVEAGALPSDSIEDIKDFVNNVWETNKHIDVEPEEMNWQNIVDEAVANDGIGEPILDPNIEKVEIEPDENSEEKMEEPQSSKRDKFIQKLTKSSPEGISKNPDEDIIPDWILSYGALEEKQENGKVEQASSDEAVLSNKNIEFEEDGMTDHQTPINAALENDEFRSDVAEWITIDQSDKPDDKESKLNNLDDTQRIKIIKQTPEGVYEQLDEALNGSDISFAMQCIESLIETEYELDTVADRIEKYLKDKPGDIELWLVLVKIYRKLDLNEKALASLQSAQMNISI